MKYTVKTLFNAWLLTLVTTYAFAQDQGPKRHHDGRSREKIKAARAAYITDQLELTPEEAEKFWPVYNEFSEKRMAIQKQYREASQNPDTKKTAEENDKDLIELRLKLKQQQLDLEKTYSSKLLKIISPHKLKALPEAEQNFRQMVFRHAHRENMANPKRQNMKDRSLQRN